MERRSSCRITHHVSCPRKTGEREGMGREGEREGGKEGGREGRKEGEIGGRRVGGGIGGREGVSE